MKDMQNPNGLFNNVNSTSFKTSNRNLARKISVSTIILLLGLMFVSVVSAQTVEADCEHSAWVIDKDVNGLNVRDKPSINGKIIDTLKYAADDDDKIVTVTITGYSNGWVKISKAETVGGNEEFSGIGWISAKMVTVSTQRKDGNSEKSVAIYARPDAKSKKVGTIPNEVDVEIVGFDCFGFKVKYKKQTGWLSTFDMCGNPVTTCP